MSSGTVRDWIELQAERGRLCFTLAELQAAFPDSKAQTLKMALLRARKSRIIVSAWQGFYLILPPTYRSVGMLPVSEYIDKLMAYIGKPYCVALLNAAALYGAAHQRPMSMTVMTSCPPPRSTTKGNTRIDFISKLELAGGVPSELTRTIKTQFSSMVVASPEYTALSLVQYSKAAGGLSHVLTVLEELAESCRFDALPACMRDYIPTPCFQRLGYMLEQLLGETTAADALHAYLTAALSKPLRRTKLDPQSTHTPVGYDARWKVIINAQPETDSDD